MQYTCEIQIEGKLSVSFPLETIMGAISNNGGEFEILSSSIGKKRGDISSAHLRISTSSEAVLKKIISDVKKLGAIVLEEHEVTLKEIDKDGTFPPEFYSTTNLITYINFNKEWLKVDNPEMDCAIKIDPATKKASTLSIGDAQKGDMVVCDGPGIRVIPLEQPNEKQKQTFEFMGSNVSSERPTEKIIHQIAEEMRQIKKDGYKIAWVVGPAAVHTGGGKYLASLIRNGYVDILFGGNAVATHDIELALYKTALGVNLEEGIPVDKGHEHHLRAINQIRRAGSIRAAVEQGILKSGIMYECIKNNIKYVLAGSIRDDGPLPDVITDCIKAQDAMRKCLPDVKMVIMISTMLHSIATGNMLPAYVKTVCVDINPATVTKLMDRGSHQAFGIVTDVLPFLREMANSLQCQTQHSLTSMPLLSHSS